jgi:hypothetical protein
MNLQENYGIHKEKTRKQWNHYKKEKVKEKEKLSKLLLLLIK